jgi:hypothetical protein
MNGDRKLFRQISSTKAIVSNCSSFASLLTEINVLKMTRSAIYNIAVLVIFSVSFVCLFDKMSISCGEERHAQFP